MFFFLSVLPLLFLSFLSCPLSFISLSPQRNTGEFTILFLFSFHLLLRLFFFFLRLSFFFTFNLLLHLFLLFLTHFLSLIRFFPPPLPRSSFTAFRLLHHLFLFLSIFRWLRLYLPPPLPSRLCLPHPLPNTSPLLHLILLLPSFFSRVLAASFNTHPS